MDEFGVAFTIFGYDIKWYSILIAVGVLIAYFLVSSESKRFGIKKEFIFNLMFWTIIVGIICARVYYVIFNWDYYSVNLNEIYKIWNGGLAIHGAILGGLIVIIAYSKRYGALPGRITDMIVPALILGQAIGRWGNFFNHEAFGSSVTYQTLIDMKIIPSFIIDNMYINGVYHLPMFYFESIWCIIGFIIMLFLRRRKYQKCGHLTAFYLIWYGVGRYFIESFRTDSLMFGNIRVAQIISILFVVSGLILSFILSRKPKLDELYNTSEIEDIKY
jgi:phosphatidylglycerol---prolipoprotein diacylglyceryl transferase